MRRCKGRRCHLNPTHLPETPSLFHADYSLFRSFLSFGYGDWCSAHGKRSRWETKRSRRDNKRYRVQKKRYSGHTNWYPGQGKSYPRDTKSSLQASKSYRGVPKFYVGERKKNPAAAFLCCGGTYFLFQYADNERVRLIQGAGGGSTRGRPGKRCWRSA